MPVDVEFEGGRAVDRLIGGGLKNRQLHIIQQDTQSTIGHSRQSLNSRLDREDMFRKASFEGDLPMVKQLLAQGIPVDCTMAGDGVTALMLASQRGHVDVVRLLLERGAEVNRGDRHHEQPILYAFRKSRSQETLSVLLEHDADVDAVDADSRTLLMLASSNGMAGMVYQLLLFGADPYLTSKGTTAMHFAIMLDQKEALAQMLSHGVDANHWDYEKRTPLMLAARAGSAEMVTLLFENRADPLIEDTTGLTALEYCGDDQKMICAFGTNQYISRFQWRFFQMCGCFCCWTTPREPEPEPEPSFLDIEEPAPAEPEAAPPEPAPPELPPKPRRKPRVDYRGDNYLEQLAKGKKKG